MQRISFYVPDSHLEVVKRAMFAAGAGRIGNYDCCSWQTKGFGQFRPLEGSEAFIGKTGEIEKLEEWKVEMVCADENTPAVIAAMKNAHPYETPAFEVYRISEL